MHLEFFDDQTGVNGSKQVAEIMRDFHFVKFFISHQVHGVTTLESGWGIMTCEGCDESRYHLPGTGHWRW